MNVARFFSPVLLGLGLVACAHQPKPYTFAADQASNDVDIVVRTLRANGLKPAEIDRSQGVVVTYWFDTGYHFRETSILESVQYPTNIFLRYRISLMPQGGKETVALTADVQRCAPLDVVVTASGTQGSCEPMPGLYPPQEKQVEAFGEKLRQAFASSPGKVGWRESPAALARAQ